MPNRGIIGLLTALGLAAQAVNGQLEPDCNPLQADCPAKKAWPEDSYFIDFTKQKGPPANWVIANDEVVNFTPQGAEFTYANKGDAPNMWTDFYMLGGRYDVEMQIAPGQGVVSSAVLWSDVQDEIDWEFSGNQFGEKPFPPPDGLWTVETNIFAQGKMWDGAATYTKDAYKPTTQFHKYSVEWDENHMNWYVDDKVVRSVQAKDTPEGFVFPQSPMKLQLGLWGGGNPDNNYWTIQWAGGEIDMTKAPYTMLVKSVKITNKYPACQYKYKDRSGKIGGIEKLQDGCGSTPKPVPQGSPNLVKNNPAVEAYPTGSPDEKPESLTTANPETSPKSAPTNSPDGYPVSPQSSPSEPKPDTSPSPGSSATDASPSTSPVRQSATTSVASTAGTTSAATTSGYPVDTPSTSGGILSSLSSYILGSSTDIAPAASRTASGASAGTSSNPSTSGSATPPGYPATPASEIGSYKASSSLATASSQGIAPGSSSASTAAPSSSAISSSSGPVPGYGTFSSGSVAGSSSAPGSSILGSASAILSSSSGVASTGAIVSSASSVPATASYALSSSVASVSASASSGAAASNSTVAVPTSSIPQSETIPTSYSTSTEIVTSSMSTVYSTNVVTISSCAPTVTNCPVGQVTTESISLYTTICPVTQTILDGKTYGGIIEAVDSATPTSSVPSQSASQSASATPAISSIPGSSYATGFVPSAGTSSSIFASSMSFFNSTSAAAESQTMMPTLSASNSSIPTPTQLTTSTVYSSNVYTITSCAPGVTNCPAKLGQVTTELVSLYTTVCPVSELDVPTTKAGSSVLPVSTGTAPIPAYSSIASNGSVSSAPLMTTSTVYTSSVYSTLGSITTEKVALYTTVCPVSDQSSALPSQTKQPVSETVKIPSSSSIPAVSSNLPVPGSSAPVIVPSSSTAVVPSYITSTVYATNIYTVTSCAPEVTDCPNKLGQVTTEIVPVSTTVSLTSEKTTAPAQTSGPQGVSGGASYTTAAVTFSNTLSNSVVVITSTISFIDTPAPANPAPYPTGAGTTAGTSAVAPGSGGPYKNTTRPCTTLTLGNYFTTVIEYASITQQPPASVSSGSVATSYFAPSSAPVPAGDVPSYSMSEFASTLAIGSSSVVVTSSANVPVVTASQPPASYGAPAAGSDGITTLTNKQTVTDTISLTKSKGPSPNPSQNPGQPQQQQQPATCLCEDSAAAAAAATVTVTTTVAQATVTVTAVNNDEPPLPSSSSGGSGSSSSSNYGTGVPGAGAGASGYPTSASTGLPSRRWFRRGGAHGHGYGHGHGH